MRSINLKKILLISVLLLLAAPLFAQARLTGRVVDPEGKPVAGAEVKLSSDRVPEVRPVTTDRNGKWVILLPIGGPWNVDISREDYATFRGSVVVSEAGRMPPLESTIQPQRPVEPAPEERIVPESNVPPEAVAAVEAGERLLRLATGNATPGDLEVLGLDAATPSPAPEEQREIYRGAVTQFEKARELLPEHVEIKKALARAYYASGQIEPAVEVLNEVLEAEPGNVGIALVLVNLLAEEGELEQAREVLDALPSGSLSEPTAVINVAILFLNRGESREAHRYADRAVSIDPLRGETYYYRGLAALQMENMADAKADFRKVVDLAPESSEAADAKDLLDQMNR
jgi:Flp pilus assembly protein TadD